MVTAAMVVCEPGRQGVLGAAVQTAWPGAFVRGAVRAAAAVYFPGTRQLLARYPLAVAFEAIDPRLERAARSLRATPWHAFRRVTLPPIARGADRRRPGVRPLDPRVWRGGDHRIRNEVLMLG
jgi:ABC-type molybdate transport system permease subunit